MIKVKWHGVEFYVGINHSIEAYYISQQYESDILNHIKYQYGYYEITYQIIKYLRAYFNELALLEISPTTTQVGLCSYSVEIDLQGTGPVALMLYCQSEEKLALLLRQYFVMKWPLSLDVADSDCDSCESTYKDNVLNDDDLLCYPVITGVSYLSSSDFLSLEVGDALVIQETTPFIQLGSKCRVILDDTAEGMMVKDVSYNEE